MSSELPSPKDPRPKSNVQIIPNPRASGTGPHKSQPAILFKTQNQVLPMPNAMNDLNSIFRTLVDHDGDISCSIVHKLRPFTICCTSLCNRHRFFYCKLSHSSEELKNNDDSCWRGKQAKGGYVHRGNRARYVPIMINKCSKNWIEVIHCIRHWKNLILSFE